MQGKEILIINYSFPPYPGIGGRRMAKLAKYLARQGYIIHVLSSENTTNQISLWSDDVKNDNIRIYTLPSMYPKVLSRGVQSLSDKIKFRLWKWALTTLSKGTVFERSFFWRKQLVSRATELIDIHKIKNVIVTIPPYRLAYYATFIKKNRPGINLIADFRDPWTDNESFHGFKNISEARLSFEKKMEMKVLEMSNKIVTVANQTTNYLENRLGKDREKFLTIPNGYDPADINLKQESEPGDKIIFIHTGTVYPTLEYVIQPMIDFVADLKEKNPDLYRKLKFEFYGSYGVDLKGMIDEKKLDCFSINPPISLTESIKKINSATVCLLMAAPDHAFAFNTKFCEYVACHKPILLLSNRGDASEFIEKNSIGKCITPEQFFRDFTQALDLIDKGRFVFNVSFDVEQFSVIRLTEKYKQLFI